MRDAFVKTLTALARRDRNITLVTGDLGFGVLKPYWEAVPDQFLNAGITEQAMTSLAAGMAVSGKTVFTYSIGNFSTVRCLEQIRNDCAGHGANVKIVCVGGGFVYGNLGMSHHATEDLALLRALPGVAVFAPADRLEAEAVTRAMVAWPGTCYLRLGRGGEAPVREELPAFSVGKAIPVTEGADVAIFSTGGIYDEVRRASELLRQMGITPTVYTFPTVKPLDEETVLRCAGTHRLIVTCEEHTVIGGFGSAVAEVMAENPSGARLLRMGIRDRFCHAVGDQRFLRHRCGLTGEQMAARIREALV